MEEVNFEEKECWKAEEQSACTKAWKVKQINIFRR